MARYLLDTNVALFFLSESKDLERDVADILDDYNNQLYISTVSVQEIIHLYKRNKIKTSWKSADEIIPSIEENFEFLPVKKEHLKTYAELYIKTGHNDPNDHVIISQAITEKLHLVSSDRAFEYYVNQKLDLYFNSR